MLLAIVDRDGHHVFLQHALHADARIKIIQHQIGKTIVGKQLQLQLRITRMELRQIGHDQHRRGQLRQGNT
ncbi:hypothetical protein D3C80_1825590 [compost metagenome]